MPTYAISAPDGNTYQIDGPPGATDDQVRAEVMRQHPGAGKAAPKPNGLVDAAKGYLSGLTESVGGIADQITHGKGTPLALVQPLLNVGGAISNRITGGKSAPVRAPTFSDLAEESAYTPKTTAGEIARTAGQMTPAAAAPGNLFARAANVVAPTIGAETGGRVANAFGASPKGVQVARAVGAVIGGGAASLRTSPRPAAGTDDAVANVFASRAKAEPDAMAAKAAEMRAAGVQPTLLDVTGQRGGRLARAVGVTNETAGETLQNNANAVSATTKPAVMARTRTLSGDQRTADQVTKHLEDARSSEAQTTYAEPYAAKVELNDPRALDALRDQEGAAAIGRAIKAARARMDTKAVADLQQLQRTASGPTGSGQVWPTTGRALDRIQIAFGNMGDALAKNGARDIASGMFKRQEIINGMLDGVEGLAPARAAFRAKSQAIDILNGKEGAYRDPFSTDPTDYKAWVDALSPEAQHANVIKIRQDTLDQLGGQRAGTVGSIDELATSQYARQNLAHALGPQAATKYLENLTARLQQRQNAAFASPNAGSRTAVLQNDTSRLDGAVKTAEVAHNLFTGNIVGLASKLAAHLKARGISDKDAEALAKAATDPAKLDDVIDSIRRLKDPETAKGFINFRGGLIGAARGVGQTQRLQAPAQQ